MASVAAESRFWVCVCEQGRAENTACQFFAAPCVKILSIYLFHPPLDLPEGARGYDCAHGTNDDYPQVGKGLGLAVTSLHGRHCVRLRKVFNVIQSLERCFYNNAEAEASCIHGAHDLTARSPHGYPHRHQEQRVQVADLKHPLQHRRVVSEHEPIRQRRGPHCPNYAFE